MFEVVSLSFPLLYALLCEPVNSFSVCTFTSDSTKSWLLIRNKYNMNPLQRKPSLASFAFLME